MESWLYQSGRLRATPTAWRLGRLFVLFTLLAHWVAALFLVLGQAQCAANQWHTIAKQHNAFTTHAVTGGDLTLTPAVTIALASYPYSNNSSSSPSSSPSLFSSASSSAPIPPALAAVCWLSRDGLTPSTGFGARYARALVYALGSLLTMCFIPVRPQTLPEIAFTCFVICLGAVMCTAMIGTFSAFFQQQYGAPAMQADRRRALLRCLDRLGLPYPTLTTVARYLAFLERAPPSTQLPVLRLLPVHVRTEVQMLLEGAALARVPFFRPLPGVFTSALAFSLRPVLLPPGHPIFRQDEPSADMYVVFLTVID